MDTYMLGSPPTRSIKMARKNSWLKSPFLLLTFILVLIASALAYYFLAKKDEKSDWRKNTVKVERGSIDMQIVATGTVKPISEVKVSPKTTGLIKKLFVKQGDKVKEGDIIARMDDSNLLGQIEAARGTYLMSLDNHEKMLNGNRPQELAISRHQEERAKRVVDQSKHNIVRLRALVDSMKQQTLRDDTFADRQANLSKQGAVSDQDRLNAVTQAKMTRANLEAAQRELAQAESTLAQYSAELEAARSQAELTAVGNRREDIQSAKHAVMQAKGNLDTLLSQQRDMTIRAPFSGVITQKYADAGAIVTPTTSAATTSATSSSIVALAGELEMVAQVAETDIGKIKMGQKVEIISNAYPDKTFHGIVRQIAPEAVVTQNVTTFEVHTSITDDKKQELLAGMNVSARFLAGKMEDVLLVPTVCVISKHGKTGVFVPAKDGKPEFKPVKTGATQEAKTAVLRGLEEGDLVFQGLSKEQLEEQGYGNNSKSGGGRGMRGGGRSMSSGKSAPIPRSLAR